MSEKTKEMKEQLFYSKKSVYEVRSEEEINAAYDFAEGYKKFLDSSKTEREAVKAGVEILKSHGFSEYHLGDKVSVGGKYYYNNRGKSLIAFVIGSEPLECGIRISAAHVDSPRIDLKQHSLYEDTGFGYLKTHYYGGIRKYQWTTIPLALHGTIVKKDGESVDVRIGDDEGDPVFCITDLLPHLAKDQAGRPLDSAFSGEGLNVLVGSRPYSTPDDPYKTNEPDDRVKLAVMKYLNDKYGVTEDDLVSSELCVVPAGKTRDIGLDRAMIGGYGHDDRVCSYPILMATAEAENPEKTVMCIFADKEEIGSEGNTGMQSSNLTDAISEISKCLGANETLVRSHSLCLSADVAAGHDPLYAEVYERMNSALCGYGVTLVKFTGSRGKSGSNDASAETVYKVRRIFDDAGVVWQTAELGKVDQGGGGTVAMYISKENIDTIDLGVPVLSMHAPFEIISKVDLYEAYLAHKAFNK
ncbi:MAG: aminopeptidase [Firmicutes bacterium]|nr:aminopeptidase [Bacillota bacterium]